MLKIRFNSSVLRLKRENMCLVWKISSFILSDSKDFRRIYKYSLSTKTSIPSEKLNLFKIFQFEEYLELMISMHFQKCLFRNILLQWTVLFNQLLRSSLLADACMSSSLNESKRYPVRLNRAACRGSFMTIRFNIVNLSGLV